MSMAEMMGRIAEIRSTISAITPPAPTRSSAAPGAVSFSSVLQDVKGGASTKDVVNVPRNLDRPGEKATLAEALRQQRQVADLTRSLNTSATNGQDTAVKPGNGRYPYADLFSAATTKYGLPAGLLPAVARTESGFKADAVSPAGARGLMQFMPATARAMGIDPNDPAQAIDGAARYLKEMLGRFGTLEKAIAAYNAGPGAVSKYGGIPPYPETQNYVPKVLNAMKELSA